MYVSVPMQAGFQPPPIGLGWGGGGDPGPLIAAVALGLFAVMGVGAWGAYKLAGGAKAGKKKRKRNLLIAAGTAVAIPVGISVVGRARQAQMDANRAASQARYPNQ